ncbi:hypothetical protein ARMGADRAFT_1086927 [Armillaria gallica]|uniref:Uncharacterized protein n=1 Tax=Armillaria gallica TaxID=47427 RepID=A0A2H3CXI5_ARMGA|nr:hypothetical protein ARMGADRAFT_1086927 [Armillaria gallica]
MHPPYEDFQYYGCGAIETATQDAPLTQSRPTLPQLLALLEGESLLIRLRELARAEDKLSSADSASNGGIGKPQTHMLSKRYYYKYFFVSDRSEGLSLSSQLMIVPSSNSVFLVRDRLLSAVINPIKRREKLIVFSSSDSRFLILILYWVRRVRNHGHAVAETRERAEKRLWKRARDGGTMLAPTVLVPRRHCADLHNTCAVRSKSLLVEKAGGGSGLDLDDDGDGDNSLNDGPQDRCRHRYSEKGYGGVAGDGGGTMAPTGTVMSVQIVASGAETRYGWARKGDGGDGSATIKTTSVITPTAYITAVDQVTMVKVSLNAVQTGSRRWEYLGEKH